MAAKNKNNLEAMRHTLAHILMQALERLYGAIPGVGPAIENGFYHDFDSKNQVTDEELPKIEKEMRKIIKENLPIKERIMPIKEGIKFLKKKKYVYTSELAEDLEKAPSSAKVAAGKKERNISFYEQGEFINMCKGPHLKSTGDINPDSFQLTKVAGAYWRGDEKNKMIQRIYGVAFQTKKELDDYFKMIKEAEKRDHRKIGKEMDLFSFHEEGTGFPFWHPKGTILYNLLTDFIKEENKKRGYGEVKTPIILNKSLWITSGHWEKFRDDMYFTEIDGLEFAIKPMNCPGGLLIYKEKLRSYHNLPVRYSEFGLVHRHELSGVLHGLFRARAFIQDDAHSFCAPEQLNGEIIQMVDYALDVYKTFGFNDYEIFIATKPEKHIGDEEVWTKATNALAKALKARKIDYGIKEGEGAFYGPKIEFNIKDAIGRNWQLGTIQVDFSMPKRFGAFYIDNHGHKNTPVMVHRAILGSLERFIGILIEHYIGAFPVWLSPAQVKIISVGEAHIEYGKKLAEEFRNNDIRAEVDDHNETVGNKIRKAIEEKAPYILVVGDREIASGKLAVRVRGKKEAREISKGDFISEIKRKIADKE
jgi:threonyl-tRNA synthetase